MIHLDKKLVQELCIPWQDALVIKLMGKSVGYLVLKDYLKTMETTRGYKLMDIDNRFFMVKFDKEEEDINKVIEGRPWMLFDHYLEVQTWTPEFISPEAKITHTLVWLCFPGFNMVYYDESILLMLAEAIGVPVRVDLNTLNFARGKFA